jgi:hypothetical protein
MKRCLLVVAIVLATALPAAAGTSVPMEAKVYFTSPSELLAKLGPVLGRLDIFTEGRNAEGSPYLLIATDRDQLRAIQAAGLKTEVTWADLREKYRVMSGRTGTGSPTSSDFGYFFNYYEMTDTINHLLANYPSITTNATPGYSYENRPLLCIKISDNPLVNEGEPQVFVNGATHAREPMGTHACVAFASLLCMNYGHDSLITWLVNNREIYILPVMNPDGYVYNSDVIPSNPYWRKNRNLTSPRTSGVDLNRNYGYRWGWDDDGSSPYPDDETYRGPARWSEPETQVIRDFEAAHKFRTCMDFHTFGQYNLYAWGWTPDYPPEYATILYPCGETLLAHNGYMQTGPTNTTIYPVNGSSVDCEQADTLLNGSHKFITYGFSTELGIYDFWYGENNPAYVDNEVAINIPNVYFLTRIAGVWFEPAGMVVNDTANGNANGQLDPGERASFWFKVKNRAIHPLDTAKAVTAVLKTSDTMVQVLTSSANFPAIPRQTTAHNGASQFQVQCNRNAAPGTNVNLRLEVTFTDDNVTIMAPVAYRITIGSHAAIGGEATRDYSGATPTLTAFPNPTRGKITFEAVTPAAVRVASVGIYGEDGHLVRTLAAPAGTSSRVLWNTSDNADQAVPAGIYFARLEGYSPRGTGSPEFTRIVVVR